MSTEPETIETEIEELDGALALTAVTKAEIDIQITTAKVYPRSIVAFKRQALELATLDQETARTMFYSLPARKGSDKAIVGMSVRLAEVAQSCWGNMRSESDIVSIDDKHVTAMGSCFDLEKNVATRIRVKRRITTREGKRFSDDMIGVTANAAASIALREAIFKIIPRALLKEIYDKATLTALGENKSHSELRNEACEWFIKRGVKLERVLAKLGRKGVDDVSRDDLIVLMGFMTTIKEGEMSAEEIFAEASESGQSDAADDLTRKIKAHAAKAAPGPQNTAPVTVVVLADTDGDLADGGAQ